MNIDKPFNHFWEQLVRLGNGLNELRNRIYEVRGEKLYPVEIHVLSTIYENPEIGVVKLAEQLGVTKGAVSQKIRILCERGFLSIRKIDGNRKELLLTEKGKEICMIHDELSQQMMYEIKQKFQQFSKDEMQILIKGLAVLNQYFDKYEVDSNDLPEISG